MLLDFFMHPLNMHFQVAFAEASEGTVVTAELFPSVFAHMNYKVGFDGTCIVTLQTFIRLLIGMNSEVCLK